MRSKNYLLWGLAFAFLLSSNSCKPKESAYKAAYEAARAREIQDDYYPVEEVTPVTKPTYDSSADLVQKEKVTVIDGAGIKQYSIVIGTFLNRTNAVSLKDRMANQGFNSFLAQNERGMYRVIVATYSDRTEAAVERNRIKDKYYPNFQDAWILDNQ